MAGRASGAEAAGGARRRRRRAGAAVTGSILAHAAVLAWLSLRFAPPPPSRPADVPEFQVELIHRQPASVPLAVARPEAPPSSAGSALAPAARTSTAPSDAPPPPAPSTPPAPPPAPATAPGTNAPPNLGAGTDPFAGPSAGDVRGLLRGALGCAHADFLHLDAAERASCAERLGLAARTAPRIDPIPAEKRAYYDAVAAAYARMNAPPSNAPAWLKGAPHNDVLADRGGLTIPMVGCAMRFGVPRGWKSYHDVPPHALKLAKLGPISCFVPPPQGRGTEESGVQAPASLRERTDDAAHMKALEPPPG